MTRARFLATATVVLGILALTAAAAPAAPRVDGKKVTTSAAEAQTTDTKGADPKSTDSKSSDPQTTDPKASDAKKGTPRVKQSAIITMDKGGEIKIDFYPADAPKTVENFVTLAKKGFYDGLTFHRVEPGFVAQGGDPKGNGTGGPGYQIKAEFNKQKHVRGTVAMARSQNPDSAGSQFYICFKPAPFLDGNYTVFGIVTSGMDVVDGIKIGDKMKSVKIVEAAQ